MSLWPVRRARILGRGRFTLVVVLAVALLTLVLVPPGTAGPARISALPASSTCQSAPLAVSTSSPAVSASGWLGRSPESRSSASFSPPAGSVVVVTVLARDAYAPAGWTSESLTDSLGTHLSWKLARFQGDTSSMGAVGVWWAYANTAPGTMTVTASLAVGGGQYVDSIGVAVKVFTGASATAPIGAVAAGDYTGQHLSVPLTPSATGSALFLAASDGKYTGKPVAGSSDYATDSVDSYNTAAAQEWAGTSAGPARTTSTAAQTLSIQLRS